MTATPTYWPKAARTLAQRDPVMKRLIRTYPEAQLVSRGSAFYTLARAIAGQQISVKAADTVWKRLEGTLGQVVPQRALSLDPSALRACGLSARKVEYMLALAQFFHANPITPMEWQAMDDAAVLRTLTALPGIGRWTAEMFLIFHLQRPDVFPLADLGLLKAVYRHYNNSAPLPKEEVLTLAERWQPYRTVATWYLWRALDPEPVLY